MAGQGKFQPWKLKLPVGIWENIFWYRSANKDCIRCFFAWSRKKDGSPQEIQQNSTQWIHEALEMKLMNHCTWKSVGRWILHMKKKKKKKKKILLKLFNKGSTSCNCDMGHVIWNSFGWSGLRQCLNKLYPEIWLVGSINKNQKPSRSLQTNRHTNPLDPMYTLPSGPSLIPCGEKVRTPLLPSLLMLLVDNSVGIVYVRFF